MSNVVYVSKSRLERKQGPVRVAHLPGESQPVIYSVHGAIAEHYKVDPAKIGESTRQPSITLFPRPRVECWERLEVRWKRAKSMPATAS
jgi:hypothetical protein